MALTIKVPATSANIGLKDSKSAWDCQLNLYLTLHVGEASSEWVITHPFGEEIPTNEENLIIETALKVCPTLAPHKLVCESEIPLTRGLGSSSSANRCGNRIGQCIRELTVN